MRTRIVYEGILHKQVYLDSGYLEKGAVKSYHKTGLDILYAQFSDQYDGIYEGEIVSVSRNANYCGIWQLYPIPSTSECYQPPVGCDVDIHKHA